MAVQRPALSGPLHAAGHVILVVLGWGIFGGFWWFILMQKTHPPLSSIVWLLAGTLVLLPVITLYWVLHNRGIYARKGPRRQVQVVETLYEQDWAGRPVRARFDLLRQARLITIDSNAMEKRFQAQVDPQPSLNVA